MSAVDGRVLILALLVLACLGWLAHSVRHDRRIAREDRAQVVRLDDYRGSGDGPRRRAG